MNPMKKIRIEKITLNIGSGADQNKLKKGMKLIENLTGKKPVKTLAKKRIPTWNTRPGLPVGCKLTLRGKKAEKLIKRLLSARENRITESCFDENGNVSFGVPEYIEIPEMKYDPEIGIMGLQISVTLERPGFRIKRRKNKKKKIGKSHKISKNESIDFFKEKFNIIMEEK
ncbi:50S ribosomal protein L5 [Candidatus Woesearchaeota archaeon]|nr:50S ribosomal protein L5 [Candidatus Woesearchaeota archaeon]